MIICIIQARMGSTRLPGKVLKEVNGIPLLKYQVDRVNKTKTLDKIVVATSVLSDDDEIYRFCIENNIECFRGSENDVLARYYKCAIKYNAKTIVRLTADCPLIDPIIIDKVINLFKIKGVDYAANTAPPENSTFPDGTDVEVFTMAGLEKVHRECNNPHDKEHVTFYFWKYNNGFNTAQLINEENYSKYRFTVDYPEDFEVVEFIIKKIKKKKIFGHMEEVINLINEAPDIKEKNSKYYFGIGWSK